MTVYEKLNRVLAHVVQHKMTLIQDAAYIHKHVFNEELPMIEVEHIFEKILNSGHVKVHNGHFFSYNLNTEIFLEEGGYGQIYKKANSINGSGSGNQTPASVDHEAVKVIGEQPMKTTTVFPSYAWGDPNHEMQVAQLVNHLREQGFDANFDKAMAQEETAINFTKMMVKALQYDKVLLVLSKIYKEKADEFKGGVGYEIEMVLADMRNKPNKYILVAFNGITDDIKPFALQTHEIVDLSRHAGYDKLYRKLTGQVEFVLAPIAKKTPVLPPVEIGRLNTIKPQNVVKMMDPIVSPRTSSSFLREYNWIAFDVILAFKNVSPDALAQFTYTVNFKNTLLNDLDNATGPLNSYTQLRFDVDKTLFVGMVYTADPLALKVRWHHLKEIINSKITVEVFTDYGAYKHEYIAGEFLQVRRSGDTYGPLIPLNQAPFKSRF